MKNKWLSNLLRVVLSLGTLALLIRHVGGSEVLTVLRQADLWLLAVAWGLFLLGVVVRAFRWRALLHGLGLRPPFGTLLRLYLIGNFFNAFLPSGFGGDVVRVLEFARDENGAAALGTVLVDRLTGILSLLALGLLILPFSPDLPFWLSGTLAAFALGGLIGGALLLQGRWLRRVTSFLPPSLSLEGSGKLAQLYAAISGCGARAVWQAVAFSTLFNLINIVIYWLCGRAVGLAVGLKFYFVAVPLLSLTLLLPISVGGLGARDWVAQPLFASVGIAPQVAAGMTLSVYAVTAAAGLVGGVLYLGQGIGGIFKPAEKAR